MPKDKNPKGAFDYAIQVLEQRRDKLKEKGTKSKSANEHMDDIKRALDVLRINNLPVGVPVNPRAALAEQPKPLEPLVA